MQAVQVSQASSDRSPRIMLVAAYAALVGAASFALGMGEAFGGDVPALGRVLIGMIGVVGGALLWTRPRLGFDIVLIWAMLQIPFIAWSAEGSITSQLIDLPLTFSSSTSVNGVVTSSSEFGINLVGLILAIAVSRMRGFWIVRHR